MRQRVSRAFRGSITALLFGALAAGGVSFGYLAATWNDQGSLATQADAQKPPHDQIVGGLLAQLDRPPAQ
jgi:hypothetical protein